MVERPFADRRPVGPLMDINFDRDMGEKVQLGVSGISMPDIRKSPMNVLYVLDTNVATLPRDIRSGTLSDKIKDKFNGSPWIKVKRSGTSGKAPFDEQAVIAQLRSDSLPVQESQVNAAANTIERHYANQDFPVDVKNILFDTE